MRQLDIQPLQQGLPFGSRVRGVNLQLAEDPVARDQLRQLFETAGMIVFEDVEPSDELQVAISTIFGPLKEHPVPSLARVDGLPGVIIINSPANSGGVVELKGRQLSHWLPWHYDHCYNDELNRAGVLRAIELVDIGGITGFADGVAIYRAFSKELLAQIEDRDIIYTLNTQYENMRFGRPDDFDVVRSKPMPPGFSDTVRAMPRALHPAVWTRETGEKVMNISPWMAEGISGDESEAGDTLLETVCQEVNRLANQFSYQHKWKPTDMIIWDNWRMLHCVSGHDPSLGRVMVRTTIKGDYGLGRFEGGRAGGKILSDTTV